MTSQARLRLGARIAQGGMAEVFAARLIGPAGFEKDVAVKRVLPRYASDPVFLQRFLSEARLAARLSHPNIVQIFELGDDGRDHYIVMEAVRGATLRGLMRRLEEHGERMPRGAALFVAQSICAGLAHAHEQTGADGRPLNIIHRDVSPQNVLIGFEGAVKVIDFGIAQAISSDRLTQVGQRMGKAHYMSPEQIRSEPLDPRSDLFAVGVLLHEMLTGVRPFEAANDIDVVDLILAGRRPPVRSLRAGLEAPLVDLIDCALSPDRAHRPPTARAFAAALGNAAELTGQRANHHTLEELLRRLFPEQATEPWPVDDVRLGEGEHTHTQGGGREITLVSGSGPSDATRSMPVRRRSRAWAAVLGGVAGAAGLAAIWVAAAAPADPMRADAADAAAVPVDVAVEAAPPAPLDAGPAAEAERDSGPLQPVDDAAAAELHADDGEDDDPAAIDDALPVEKPAAPTPDKARRSKKAAPKLGRIVVETRPWSEVTLDGKKLGITPLEQSAPVGPHTLRLFSRELNTTREIKVTLDDEKPTAIRIDLRRPD